MWRYLCSTVTEIVPLANGLLNFLGGSFSFHTRDTQKGDRAGDWDGKNRLQISGAAQSVLEVGGRVSTDFKGCWLSAHCTVRADPSAPREQPEPASKYQYLQI